MLLMSKKRVIYIISLLIIFTVIISGCSSKGSYPMDKVEESVAVSESPKASNNSAEFGSKEMMDRENPSEMEFENQVTDGRKIIKTAQIEMETTEFDKATNAIIEKTNSVGGYIESSTVTGGRKINTEDFRNRVASFTIRIPEKSYNKVLDDLNEIGNIIRNERGGSDITSEYFDSEARLKSLTIQEERLLEILKKADKVTDIIEIERELSNIRYQIENLTGTLRKWDNLVSFATINVYVHEVREITKPEPITLSDRIVNGFKNSVKGIITVAKELVVLLATLLPVIIITLIILVVVLYIIKKTRKSKGKNKKEEE